MTHAFAHRPPPPRTDQLTCCDATPAAAAVAIFASATSASSRASSLATRALSTSMVQRSNCRPVHKATNYYDSVSLTAPAGTPSASSSLTFSATTRCHGSRPASDDFLIRYDADSKSCFVHILRCTKPGFVHLLHCANPAFVHFDIAQTPVLYTCCNAQTGVLYARFSIPSPIQNHD
jgi:hypothetical protein